MHASRAPRGRSDGGWREAMDPQTLERALRSALDEVEKAHAIIGQQKQDRDAMRERIRWLSDRALFFGLASASETLVLTKNDYDALSTVRPEDQTTWASLCASVGVDPAGIITLEQFSGHRSDPHADLQALADLPVLRRAVRTASEATPPPAFPGLTIEKRKQLEQRVDNILKEILKTEQDYVEAMREVVEDFYRPLLDSSFSVEGAILDSEGVHQIFGNVEDILLISEELLQGLHTRIVVEGQRKVSDIFLNMGFAFKLYSRYISRYEKASVTLRNASQNNDKFCKWLIDTVSFVEACGADPGLARRRTFPRLTRESGSPETSASSMSLDPNASESVFEESAIEEIPTLSLDICLQKLSNQLMKPVQRVVRYQMLVEELHKNTAKLGRPTVDLELCLARLRGVNDFNNEEIRVIESKEKLQKLQTRLGGRVRLVGSQKIVKFQHHIREQELVKVHGKGDRRTARCHLALLTDELLYSRPIESTNVGNRHAELKLHARIPLEPASTRFEDIEDDEIANGFANRIAIISAKRTFVVYCAGPDGPKDKRDWLEDLERAQQAARKRTGQGAKAYQHVGISIPVYQPDGPKCSSCSNHFGVMRRRHHCRLCGALVCDRCASNFVDMRKLNSPYDTEQVWGSDVRVCDDCVKWAGIFYQDHLRFKPISPDTSSKGGRMWITPVVQKVQETRLNQLADHAKKYSEAVEHLDPEMLHAETQREVLDDETRQARVKAAWRYAMLNVADHNVHDGSRQASANANIGGLWTGWLWKRGGGTSVFGRQNWKKRWFVLTSQQLAYYENVEQHMKMTRPGDIRNTAKGTLDLLHCTVDSIDRVGLQCVITSRATGRGLHIAKFNPDNKEMIAGITTRDREDFLMLTSVLQSVVEVVVGTFGDWEHRTTRRSLAMHRDHESQKKEQAYKKAEYYAQKTQETHAHLQTVQQQIQRQADEVGPGPGGGRRQLSSHVRSSSSESCSSGRELSGWVLPPVPQQRPGSAAKLYNPAPSPRPISSAHSVTESSSQPPVPSVPPPTAPSPVADCPASLEPTRVVFGPETAHNLGINCGLRLGGNPDLARYSCCIEYFVRMEDGTDGPAKSCGKVCCYAAVRMKCGSCYARGDTARQLMLLSYACHNSRICPYALHGCSPLLCGRALVCCSCVASKCLRVL